ncbi:MAG: PQQ-binding-like beta-propeller repeat protein [Planctomycetaceae bacterium]|nr:PQQ-binding-like beta-propeller repeat protein [Planctomycetaceae bacterium]
MTTQTRAALVFAIGLGVTASPAADWPHWRGPNADGIAPVSELQFNWPDEGPRILWTAQVGTGFSAVSIAAGRAYTLGNTADIDTVWCLDAETGDVRWQASHAAPLDPNLFEGGPTATPTVDGERVFTFGRKGVAICYDADTGEELWNVSVPETCNVNVPTWGFSGSPVVTGEFVLLNAGSAGVALKRDTGAVVWMSDNSDDAGYATPRLTTFGEKPLALILSGKALHAVDPQSGTQQWEHRWITRYGVNAADPLVQGDRVFLSSGYAKGSSLLEVTPDSVGELWRTRDLRNQMSPGVLVDGFVYAVDGDAGDDCRLVCVEFESGDVRWEQPGLGSATLIASGSRLLILSDQGELVVAEASPEKYQEVSRGKVLSGKCWTTPALSDGRLYCRSAAGEVVCIDLRP